MVNAVLACRQLTAEQAAAFEQGLREAMDAFHLAPEFVARTEPAVRYAVYAEAMRLRQIAPPGDGSPFHALRSPFLARSARRQVAVARFHAEVRHATVLTELDGAPASGSGSQA